ncbi:hypothetical protein [Neorhizobium sp. JUb45]|uniref:hypothetical protein n=1 Tax=unclassified Neorhizobium TaxID=2629175 RepID=UPI00104BD8BB|nr:hypothetical protein [Neorhizobium sp. JUb45]TCR06955.1 hypothetical protein EDF70_101919 [Neorhizobium sp. JUb45]
MPGTNDIVMFVAFDRNARGETIPAFTPRQATDEAEAVNAVEILGARHAGAVAWRRESLPAIGEIGEPRIIAKRGAVGDFG